MPKLGAVLPMVVMGCAVGDHVSTSGDMVSIDDDPGIAEMSRNLPVFPNRLPLPDASGSFATVSTTGSIDMGNEFFQDLGTNGRRCVSCHLPTAGWTITPSQVRI